MKVRILAVVSLIIGTFAFLYYFNGRDPELAKIEHEILKINKEIPTGLLKKDLSLGEYREKIRSLGESDVQKEIGERLFMTSQTTAFYHPTKVKVLEMAKEHLLLAKRGKRK